MKGVEIVLKAKENIEQMYDGKIFKFKKGEKITNEEIEGLCEFLQYKCPKLVEEKELVTIPKPTPEVEVKKEEEQEVKEEEDQKYKFEKIVSKAKLSKKDKKK